MCISQWEKFKTWYGKNPIVYTIRFVHLMFLLSIIIVLVVALVTENNKFLLAAAIMLGINAFYHIIMLTLYTYSFCCDKKLPIQV